MVDQETGVIHLFMNSNKPSLCQLKKDIGVNGCKKRFTDGTRRIRYLRAEFRRNQLVFSASEQAIPDLTATLQPEGTEFDLVGPGTGIQITSAEGGIQGRLLVPALGRTFISDDHGRTWRLGRGRLGRAFSETTLMELDNGWILRNDRVSSFARREHPTRLLTYSDDGGETFPEIVSGKYLNLSVPDPMVQASMLRYAPGQLFFANCASATHRRDLTVRRTFDRGVSWTDSRLIDESCGYNSMAKTRDFYLAILYERAAKQAPNETLHEKPLDIVFQKFKLGFFDD